LPFRPAALGLRDRRRQQDGGGGRSDKRFDVQERLDVQERHGGCSDKDSVSR
jgi:hypothetical protein